MSEKILLVEGNDDQHVVLHVLRVHGIEHTLSIRITGGRENLLTILPVQLKGSGLRVLGVVIDADDELNSTWIALRNKLRRSGYVDVPDIPDRAGTIVREADKPMVGVWLMPNNEMPGALEDFASFLVPEDDDLIRRAKQTVHRIPVDKRKFSRLKIAKAVIHTWLAWQEEPGTPLGQAITKRYLDAHAESGTIFATWLDKLFDLRGTGLK